VYLLDTDVVSLILHFPGQHPHLRRRVLATSPELLFVSVVSAEEMAAGALALIRKEQKAGDKLAGYELLFRILTRLPQFQLLPFAQGSNEIFRSFAPAVRRLGRADCMIAACALHHGFTVVTRNAAHFGQIPKLRIEDWTEPAER